MNIHWALKAPNQSWINLSTFFTLVQIWGKVLFSGAAVYFVTDSLSLSWSFEIWIIFNFGGFRILIYFTPKFLSSEIFRIAPKWLFNLILESSLEKKITEMGNLLVTPVKACVICSWTDFISSSGSQLLYPICARQPENTIILQLLLLSSSFLVHWSNLRSRFEVNKWISRLIGCHWRLLAERVSQRPIYCSKCVVNGWLNELQTSPIRSTSSP